jgi:hypothetical protein
MQDFGNVIIDAYRTYHTSRRRIVEGFVGYGDPILHFQFDEEDQTLHLIVTGDCKSSIMKEEVRSIGHDLYLPFTKSLNRTEEILKEISSHYRIDNSFRPTLYSKPEKFVTGFVDVPEIIAKYGWVFTNTPSYYSETDSGKVFASTHSKSYERLYVEWENPKEGHTQWKKTMWMKDEFHFGFRVMGFLEKKGMTPNNNIALEIVIPKYEIGHLSGLMSKMLSDYLIK